MSGPTPVPLEERSHKTSLSPRADRRPRDYYAIFQKVLDEKRYETVVEGLVERAEAGDFKATRLVMEHAQGKPVQRHEIITPQQTNLDKIQQLLAAAGQPVEWSVVQPNDANDEATPQPSFSSLTVDGSAEPDD